MRTQDSGWNAGQRIRLVTGAIIALAVLVLAACEAGDPSAEIVGPTQAKVNSTVLLEGKATGATPLYGSISFTWATRAGTSGAWKDVRYEVKSVDESGSAIDQAVFDAPSAPGTTQYKLTARIWQTHNWDELIYRWDTHAIRFTE